MSHTFEPGLEITVHASFHDVSAAEWNALERGDFLFAQHDFLTALEDSGSLGRRTGWHPRVITVRENDALVGATPLFLRTNSYGEYIFDWSWANAAERAGLRYYPKFTAAIPFTPATGPKLLLAPHADVARITEALITAARAEVAASDASSLHWLFCTAGEAERFAAAGFAVRSSYQYHWRNRDYASFDDFLAALRSKRRNEIRRERAAVAALGFKIERLTGSDLQPAHAALMYEFYTSTLDKKGGLGYLTPQFFELLFKRLPQQILFVLASTPEGRPVAGTLNLFSEQTLYGRYWGCVEGYRNLHFELCYYQTIEWAIARGLTLFEAGAQGEQKFTRGFEPSWCYSAHELGAEGLDRAVREFIASEREGLEELFADYREHDSYKRPGDAQTSRI